MAGPQTMAVPTVGVGPWGVLPRPISVSSDRSAIIDRTGAATAETIMA
jgi:hypothetical protein